MVLHQGQLLKQLPIHGLHQRVLPFAEYVRLIAQEAHHEWRWHFKAG
jgi:hypothetical protein